MWTEELVRFGGDAGRIFDGSFVHEFLLRLQVQEGPVAAAKEYFDTCVPVMAQVRAAGHFERCGALEEELSRRGRHYLSVIRGTTRGTAHRMGSDRPVDGPLRQAEDDYLRTCVTAYAAALEGGRPDCLRWTADILAFHHRRSRVLAGHGVTAGAAARDARRQCLNLAAGWERGGQIFCGEAFDAYCSEYADTVVDPEPGAPEAADAADAACRWAVVIQEEWSPPMPTEAPVFPRTSTFWGATWHQAETQARDTCRSLARLLLTESNSRHTVECTVLESCCVTIPGGVDEPKFPCSHTLHEAEPDTGE
ncbi:MAG: hypothetical protein F4Y02_15420 [Chloroflexi bacterium]|nr:hypothetical protein [Chloroflexota bacterium]